MSLASCNAAATSFLGLPRPLGLLRNLSASSTESKWSGARVEVEDLRLGFLGVDGISIAGMAPSGEFVKTKAIGVGTMVLGGVFELAMSIDGMKAIEAYNKWWI